MSKVWIRIWKDADIKEIEAHIMIVGELTANCGACRELGLNYQKEQKCRNCGTDFRYISSRAASGSHEQYAVIKRIKDRRPDLTFVDYDDYKKLTSKSKARDFLRGE